MPKDITPLSPDRRPLGRLQAPASGLAAAIYNRPGTAAQIQAPDDWDRILTAVRNRKWLVVGVTLLGTAVGLVGARFVRPKYEARATVWIQTPDPGQQERDRDRGPIATAELLGSAASWLDLLRSHIVLDSVVRQWRLYLAPRSAADTATLATLTVPGDVRPGRYRLEVAQTGTSFRLLDIEHKIVLQEGTLGDSVGAPLGFAWVPPTGQLRPGAKVDFTIATTTDAAVKLAEQLKVRAPQDENFVRIELRGPNAADVTGVVNAVADRFVAAAADLKRQRLSELTAILKDQLDHAQVNLRAAEAGLTAFRVRNAIRPSEGPAQGADGRRTTADPTYASYVDLQVAIGALARDRQAIAEVLGQGADSGVAVDALAMIGAVQRSSELSGALHELSQDQATLRAMRFRYSDTYPPVRHLAEQVDTLARHVIPDLSRTLMAGLAARERELTQRADSTRGVLQRAPPEALDEIRLARDQTSAEQLFSDLQHRYQEARLAEVSTLPDVRILERAVRPTRPASNTAPLLVIVACLCSVGAGVLGAVLRDRADPKFRSPEQVSQAMGLPILGAVPHMHRANGTSTRAEEDGAKAVEALRGIRLNVQHAYGAAGPLLLTVTSAGRGEGKSFVTSNLAQAFADVGWRTLLIDGDVRLGALHRTFQRSRRPGLTDLLAGRVDVNDAIQSTTNPLLSFVGAGARMHRGPELLGSAAMNRLLTALRSAYDVILVDSAPLAAGVDPYALGVATGNVVVVVRTGVTDRAIAEAKVEVFHRLPVRLLGAVLNDVPEGPVHGYYAYYMTGSEMEEDDPQGRSSQILLPDVS